MARPKVDDELVAVNLKLEKDVVDQLDFEWRDQQYRNRTAYLVEAIETFIEGIRCPDCGAMNPKGGHVCSVCLRPLPGDRRVHVDVMVNGNKIAIPSRKSEEKKRKKGW